MEEQPSAESLPYIEDGSPGSLEEAAACRGDYEKAYATLKSIGKGAFGFVKLAQKRETNEMVRGLCIINRSSLCRVYVLFRLL